MDANEKSLILPFKRLLVRLSRELNTKDVGVLKYVAELGDAVAEDCDSCLDVFKQLERLEKITPNNLDFLKQFFEDIKRRDLISVIGMICIHLLLQIRFCLCLIQFNVI